MIYITGDTHGDFRRFSTNAFPEQKEMSKNDFVIICGDFGGVWCDTPSERYWLDWLSEKNFTLLFIDGNHENFDRLYGGEFEVVDFHGGKAHRIRDGIYHLMRGQVFELCGKKFFTFGGASSHDIKDGILSIDDYGDKRKLIDDYNRRTHRGQMLRINHVSWWEEELPSDSEMDLATENLARNGNKVDFIISHCAPSSVAAIMGYHDNDKLNEFLERVAGAVSFHRWFFGHYHDNQQLLGRYIMLYAQMVRVV